MWVDVNDVGKKVVLLMPLVVDRLSAVLATPSMVEVLLLFCQIDADESLN
jgi:hypothetical protein